jgi:hypothetical protein
VLNSSIFKPTSLRQKRQSEGLAMPACSVHGALRR